MGGPPLALLAFFVVLGHTRWDASTIVVLTCLTLALRSCYKSSRQTSTNSLILCCGLVCNVSHSRLL